MLGDTDASYVGISLVPCLKKNKTGNVRSAKHFKRVRHKRKNKFSFLMSSYLRRRQQCKILRVLVWKGNSEFYFVLLLSHACRCTETCMYRTRYFCPIVSKRGFSQPNLL